MFRKVELEDLRPDKYYYATNDKFDNLTVVMPYKAAKEEWWKYQPWKKGQKVDRTTELWVKQRRRYEKIMTRGVPYSKWPWGWEEISNHIPILALSFEFYVPLPRPPVVETTTGTKAQVQAVKDVLAKKGVPEEMGTGPLGNILKMAGIKTPPKGSTAGRRTRKHTKRSHKTRRR